jgi:hypothetical protein
MSSNPPKKFLQAIGVACSVVLLTLAMSVVDAREIKVRFAKGETSQTFLGSWKSETDTYVFRAKKGQRISIQLNDGRKASTKLRATLYKYCGEEYGAPMADSVMKFEAILPCSDQYSIDIAPSSDGALKADELEYSFTISIK